MNSAKSLFLVLLVRQRAGRFKLGTSVAQIQQRNLRITKHLDKLERADISTATKPRALSTMASQNVRYTASKKVLASIRRSAPLFPGVNVVLFCA
jgi:hypothetical protein